jgi:hypothetical protein
MDCEYTSRSFQITTRCYGISAPLLHGFEQVNLQNLENVTKEASVTLSGYFFVSPARPATMNEPNTYPSNLWT